MNFGLMLAVLFAVCYQSVHAFSHSIKQDSEHDHSHSKSNKNLVYKISEKEDCPVCVEGKDCDCILEIPVESVFEKLM